MLVLRTLYALQDRKWIVSTQYIQLQRLLALLRWVPHTPQHNVLDVWRGTVFEQSTHVLQFHPRRFGKEKVEHWKGDEQHQPNK
jgi:hypothetical protein